MPVSRKRFAPKIRWTRNLLRLPALSVRQPWAWLIVNGYKDVENRGRTTHYRGPLLIHAGLNETDLDENTLNRIEQRFGIRLPREYDLGGVIGVVDIIGSESRSGSPWHNRGAIGWVRSKPRRLGFKSCKGALGLFKPKFARER